MRGNYQNEKMMGFRKTGYTLLAISHQDDKHLQKINLPCSRLPVLVRENSCYGRSEDAPFR